MKHAIFVFAAFASCAVLAETPADQLSAKAAEKAATDAWWQLKKNADALVKRDFTGGFANYWHDNIDAARELYETVFTNAVMRNAEKIDACREIAKCHLEATRDEKSALAALERAFALEGLTDAERARAEKNRHEIKVLMRLEAQMPEVLEKAKARTEADFLKAFGEIDPKRGPDLRLLSQYAELVAPQGFDAFRQKAVARVLELEQAYSKSNCRKAIWMFASGFRANGMTLAADPRYPGLILELAESAPDGSGPDPHWMFTFFKGRTGYEKPAIRYAKLSAATEKDLNPNDANGRKRIGEAKKYLTLKDVGGDPRRAVKACREYLASVGKADDAVELAGLLSEQARDFLRSGDEKGARAIWDERVKLVPPRDTSRLDCFLWKGAPHDIRGILLSDVYGKARKGLLVHKYGDNLKFLIETDSAILGREMTTDKGEKFRPTELLSFCDDEGVKIFLRSFPGNIEDIRAGRARAPGYETYVATGIDDPYRCILFDPSEGGKLNDSFTTQYDNGTGYRNLRDLKGNLRSESLYLDDGVATLISIPWAAAFASIPSKSPCWYLEAISWDHGGLSFGGSVSVHHRSSFGELKFTGVGTAELAAIKRRLLYSVRAKLGEAVSARSNGFAEKWSDPELGDQEFYLAEVKPFVERLKADADRIDPALSDAEVVEIYDRIAEEAFNLDYCISRLRTKWLERKHTETEENR
jgi:hypothetical protein